MHYIVAIRDESVKFCLDWCHCAYLKRHSKRLCHLYKKAAVIKVIYAEETVDPNLVKYRYKKGFTMTKKVQSYSAEFKAEVIKVDYR